MLKYIFVSGGVISGIGKGTTVASIGLLLKSAGYKVTPTQFGEEKKFDILTDEQNINLQMAAGQNLNKVLGKIIISDWWQTADDEMKEKAINKYTEDARFYARMGMLNFLLSDIKDQNQKILKLKELIKDGFVNKEMYNKFMLK